MDFKKQLAETAQVSIATVSYALSDSPQVSEMTRAKIKKIAKELNYVPNLSAQNLRTNNSNLIYALLNTYQGNFNGNVLQEIQLIFKEYGYDLLATSGSIPDIVKTNTVDGGIILNFAVPTPTLLDLASTKPLVLLSNEVQHENIANVVIDNELGMKYLLDLFKESYHRNLCFIVGEERSYNNGQRVKAAEFYYHKMFQKSDFQERVYQGEFNSEIAYELGLTILKEQKHDAFICLNDDMALGIYHAAADLGLTVGKDISIAGFDDSYLSNIISPKLTTIHIDKHAWAQAVVQAYLDLKKGTPQEKVNKVKPKLTLRDSVRLRK